MVPQASAAGPVKHLVLGDGGGSAEGWQSVEGAAGAAGPVEHIVLGDGGAGIPLKVPPAHVRGNQG